MPRIPRMLIKDEVAYYHVISRTALDGFPLGSEDKEYFLTLLKFLSSVYFVDVIGFCIMDNHFHLLVKTYPEEMINVEDVKKSFECYYKGKRKFVHGQCESFRSKWCNLSEFIKELKQSFTRYYNKKHGRKGYFWADRYKSVIIEKGEGLLNCAAYIDLNPIRAGIVKRPEDYRWSSLGYLAGTANKDNWIKLEKELEQGFESYREYVYECGALEKNKGAVIEEKILKTERQRKFALSKRDRFLYRTRYFSEGVFLGSKEFVRKNFKRFKKILKVEKDRRPIVIKGLDSLFSFRLTEWG